MNLLFDNFKEFLSIRTETQDLDQGKLKQYIADSFASNCIVENITLNNSIVGFIVKINDRAERPGIIFSGHCDTVPASGLAVCEDSFAISGRGAVDMKYFVSCVQSIVPEIKKNKFSFPIYLCLSCDEEVSTIGARMIIDRLKNEKTCFNLCIVGEPTNFIPCNMHCGYYGIRFKIKTINGHSSLNTLKNNAIYWAMQVIQQIIDAELCNKINISSISSEQLSSNSNASLCSFLFEFRPSIDESISRILAGIKKIVSRLPNHVVIEYSIADGFIPSFYSECSECISGLFDDVITGVFPAASEAPFYKEICDNVLVYGAGKLELAHSDKECIAKKDLLNYRDSLIRIIKNYESS